MDLIGHYSTDHKLSKVLNIDNMRSPGRISFSKNGTWAVTDSSKHCVHLFNGEDQLVKTFGTIGSTNGEFNNPKGVVFDGDDHLYVVDGSNHRVQKFDTTGNYLLQFGSKSDNGKLNSPTGIAVHNDKVYVADSGNSIISVFRLDGEYCFSFGSEEFAGLLHEMSLLILMIMCWSPLEVMKVSTSSHWMVSVLGSLVQRNNITKFIQVFHIVLLLIAMGTPLWPSILTIK